MKKQLTTLVFMLLSVVAFSQFQPQYQKTWYYEKDLSTITTADTIFIPMNFAAELGITVQGIGLDAADGVIDLLVSPDISVIGVAISNTLLPYTMGANFLASFEKSMQPFNYLVIKTTLNSVTSGTLKIWVTNKRKFDR